jgi:hypothetical protein
MMRLSKNYDEISIRYFTVKDILDFRLDIYKDILQF